MEAIGLELLRGGDRMHLHWGLVHDVHTDCQRYGVICSYSIDMADVWSLAIRHSIDLHHILLGSDPVAFVKLVGKSDASVDDQETLAAIARGVPSELRIRLSCRSNAFDCLHRILRFILGEQPSKPSDEYKKLMRHLAHKMDADTRTRIFGNPVHIEVAVHGPDLNPLHQRLTRAELFAGLTDLATKTRQHQSSPAAVADASEDDLGGRVDAGHPLVRLVVDWITLSVADMVIDDDLVQRTKVLVAAGIPVRLDWINLEPNRILCSAAALREFLVTVCDPATTLQVRMDPCWGTHGPRVTMTERDPSRQLAVLGSAILALPFTFELHLEFLPVFVKPRDRPAAITNLIVPALTRIGVPPVLKISAFDWTQADVARFSAAIAEWRDANPGKRIRVKLLTIDGVKRVDVWHAFAAALDDAESLRLSELPVDSTDALCHFLRFPSLTSLRLKSSVVASMDIFHPHSSDPDHPFNPRLERLTLDQIVLQDPSSMPRFLARLQDPSSRLSQSLRDISIHAPHYQRNDETYKLDQASIQMLAKALRVNSVLSTVWVMMEAVFDSSGAIDKSVLRAAEDEVAAACKSLAPARVRRGCTLAFSARVVAFLSVVRSELRTVPSACRSLDAEMLSVIFDYCARPVQRSAHVTMFVGDWDDDIL